MLPAQFPGRLLLRAFASNAEVPPVSQALAQFTELITRNSLHADINARSLNKLFEFMDSIVQSSEAYPPARAERLTFLINRSPSRQEPRTVNVLLKTTGGDCSTAVTRQLGGLFAASGLPPKFRWDDGMWELGRQQADRTASIAPQDAQEVVEQAIRKAPATLAADKSEGVQPSNAAALDVSAAAAIRGDHASACTAQENLTHDQSDVAEDALQLAALQASLKRLDPLLAALAAVPWHKSGSQEEQRAAAFLKAQGVDELEGQGWDIRGGLHKIWQGARDVHDLTINKDSGTTLALKALLKHAIALDVKMGQGSAGPSSKIS